MAGDDHRAATRVHRRLILRVAVAGDLPLRWSHVTIQNFSASGVFFTYDRIVTVGSLLHFKIDFPSRIIECKGRVRRVLGEGLFRGVGASFEGLDPDDNDFIDEFIVKSRTS
jgi:hypothetical protein